MGYNTKIDWCETTWSPVTGCLHPCPYCYARGMVRRFSDFDGSFTLAPPIERNVGTACSPLFELDEPRRKNVNGKLKVCPYPFGFHPTFHRYRLGLPAQWSEPRTIFVCSMGELFGDWIPDQWIQDIFAACEDAPQHRYLFLTKNPRRYLRLDGKGLLPSIDESHAEMWFGSTTPMPETKFFWSDKHNTFLSVEPIHSAGWHRALSNMPVKTDWVIIGAETGRRKDKVMPEKWWIDELADVCSEAGVPVFMKESLRNLMSDDFRQEFPWEVPHGG